MNPSCPVDMLKDLVGFSSISKRSNLDVVDYLESQLSPLGFDCVRIMSPDEPARANLLCKIGPDVNGGLMLSGHMDVVPVAGQNWDQDPFTLTEKEGRLVGRGSADMKGFIAAVVCALKKYPLNQLKKPLSLLWTYDEEVGCTGSHVAAPLLKNYFAHLPKAALIGEPTEFSVLRMHAGHVTVTVRAKGVGAHSSDPDLGVSAIKTLHHALTGIFALEDELRRETSLVEFFKRPFVIMNVGEIHGGTAVNIVPDEAHAVIGFRPLPQTSIEDIIDRMQKAARRTQPSPAADVTFSVDKCSPPMFTKEGSALEQVLRPHAFAGASSAQYATDGGNLSQQGIECLIFGPGSIDVAHKANEWIKKADVLKASEKIANVLDGWFL